MAGGRSRPARNHILKWNGHGEPMKNKSETAAAMVAGNWNCAQSVLGVFCEELNLDRETAMKLASGFGAGMARRQEVCGAVSGAIMAIGLKHGQAREDDKAAKETAYRLSRELMDRFQAEFGSCLCRELLPGIDLRQRPGSSATKRRAGRKKYAAPACASPCASWRIFSESAVPAACPEICRRKKGGDAGPRLFFHTEKDYLPRISFTRFSAP